MKKRIFVLVPILIVCILFWVREINAGYEQINLTNDKKSISVGKKYQMKVNGVKSSKIKWSSTNKKVVTVSKKGVVKAVGTGTATVKGKYRGIVFKTKFTVIPKVKSYNKLLCKDNNIEVYLKEVKDGTIYIDVKNKTKYDLYFCGDYLSINGEEYYDKIMGVWELVYANKTTILELYVYDDNGYIDYCFDGGKLKGEFSYYDSEGKILNTKIKFDKTID